MVLLFYPVCWILFGGEWRHVNFFFFSWRIIALQCCGGLCHTSTYISNNYIPTPSWTSLSSKSHTSRSSQIARLGSLCYTAVSHLLSVLHTILYICQCYFLNLSYPLLPLLCLPDHSLHLHLHVFSVNRFIGTIFLDSIYMH